MNTNEINKLVDNESLDAWKASYATLTANKASADSRLDDAQKALKLAQKASDEAVAGIGGLSIEDAEDAILAGEKACRIAIKIADHADKKFNHERDRQHIVTGLAHVPVWADAVKKRLAACKAGDAAKKAMADAEAAFSDANAQLVYARQQHCGAPLGHVLDGLVALKSEDEEMKAWASVRIDASAPVSWWQPE
jgi:hypothetical protein